MPHIWSITVPEAGCVDKIHELLFDLLIVRLPSAPKDFIYSMLVLNDLVFTGDGRGRVTCFDVPSKQKLYVLDAGQNAIRCMAATEKVLVCAGDDGNALMFDF